MAEQFLGGERLHARNFRPVAPAFQELGGVRCRFLLELVDELEQEARPRVVIHLELAELGAARYGRRWSGSAPAV